MVKTKVLLILAFGVLFVALSMAAFAMDGTKFCLDPGHGGSDPGAIGFGLEEEDVNLDICLRARTLFQQDGAIVIMTRTGDTTVSLQGRCDIANNNGCARFLASHCNAGGGTGTETFCYGSGSSSSFDFRNKVNPELVSHMQTVNRGVKTANFYVLIHTNMPAILTEVAFIDHPGDNAKLASPAWRQEAARAYLHGAQAHLGETPHDPSAPVEVIVDNTSGSFSASAGWATGTSATDKYGSDYRWRSTEAVSDLATWAPSLSGTYAVYAWWTAGSNRSPAAPYRANHTGGTTVVNANQQTNGGMWNYLGTWGFGAGNNVQLSCWAPSGYVVVADAVKFVKQ